MADPSGTEGSPSRVHVALGVARICPLSDLAAGEVPEENKTHRFKRALVEGLAPLSYSWCESLIPQRQEDKRAIPRMRTNKHSLVLRSC